LAFAKINVLPPVIVKSGFPPDGFPVGFPAGFPALIAGNPAVPGPPAGAGIPGNPEGAGGPGFPGIGNCGKLGNPESRPCRSSSIQG